MNHQDMAAVMAWLEQDPPLAELCREFPVEWEQVQQGVAASFATGKPSDVQNYLKQLEPVRVGADKLRNKLLQDAKQRQLLLSRLIIYQMARKAVRQHYISVASGVESGKVRFNRFNAMIAQKLLFESGLNRKPVSLFWFRLFWPLVWQKRFLMPLVQPEGIYCFYSRELISALAEIIGDRKCIEVGAGDGTLTRFLCSRQVNVTATDDYSWKHAIAYPDFVVKLDAEEALRRYQPQVVICSWPPSLNGFERQIFLTRCVEQYLVIGSRHRQAAGNWDAYQQQTAFTFEELPHLSTLVVPPELDSAVYLFTRKPV